MRMQALDEGRLTVCTLTRNIRVVGATDDDSDSDSLYWAQTILRIGNGEGSTSTRHLVMLPLRLIAGSLEDLITHVFGDMTGDLTGCAVLCPTNRQCATLNGHILCRFSSTLISYDAVNRIGACCFTWRVF